MRKTVLLAALAATLSSAGCFTVAGVTIGAISDSGNSRKPPRPPPQEMHGLPPGSYFAPSSPPPAENTGMSATGKGALIGLAIDTTLVVLAAVAISQMDFSWCGDDGCSD